MGPVGGVLGEDFPALLAGFGAGALVAGYRLEAQVGAGGMAVVYRARDERLGRLVALKVLAPGLAADEEFRRRFIAESRSAAAVDDPHIIPVYEAGEAGGVLFIAMRFVPGRDLRAVLAGEGPLAPERVAEFISPVASALDAAHRAGLVHRDVKPANVLVDERPGRAPHVYLSDFGVSKGAMSSAGMTASGVFLGTPDYAAPEQIQGLAVDGRADQYALACVAYQLLTGIPPFQRDQGMAVLFAHMSEPPPSLSARRPGLPGAADQVLARALAKVPEKRYGSCREFAGALRDALGTETVRVRDTVPAAGEGDTPPVRSDWVEGETIDAPVLRAALTPATVDGQRTPTPETGPPAEDLPPVRNRSRRRPAPLVWVAAVIAAAGIAVAVVLVPGGGKPSDGTPAGSGALVATLPSQVPQTSVLALAFGPGATTLAVGSEAGGARAGSAGDSTCLWDTASRKVTATLADPASQAVSAVAYSPRGTTLAVGDADGSTYLWDTAAGKISATLADPGKQGVSAVAYSPGGTTLAVGDTDGSTYLWDTATGKITATLADPGGAGVNAVAYSPAGTTVAVGDLDGSTYLWDVATGKLTATLTDPGNDTDVQTVAYNPAGTVLAAGDHGGSTYLWDVATRKVTATLTDPDSEDVMSVAFGPGGTALAAADANGRAYLWKVATGKLAATFSRDTGGSVNTVAFGPGGTTLATGNADGSVDLWRTGTST
jgi:protein kinase-like protein/WD40 domain-containing protein